MSKCPYINFLLAEWHTIYLQCNLLVWLLRNVCVCVCVGVLLSGGVQVICRNLVDTNRRLINTSPSLVSSIMQYFGSARPDASNGRRATSYSDSPTDTAIQNFALLGQFCDISALCINIWLVFLCDSSQYQLSYWLSRPLNDLYCVRCSVKLYSLPQCFLLFWSDCECSTCVMIRCCKCFTNYLRLWWWY